jgi:hypothetical protein
MAASRQRGWLPASTDTEAVGSGQAVCRDSGSVRCPCRDRADDGQGFQRRRFASHCPPATFGGPLSNSACTLEVAEGLKELVREGPPGEDERATWTLHSLAKEIVDRIETISAVSHESVRRWLGKCRIDWRRAKEWLTSPDPLYALRKAQRDRLLAWARAAPDGAAVWLDQSWFVRWPYRYWTWAAWDDRPRVAQRWNEEVDRTALYAALDDETQEAILQWAAGQPNSEVTVTFLDTLMDHWTQKGKRFIVLFWDKASWHTSQRTQQWIRDYNRQAKQQGLTRLIVCSLPTRSPWLMPLEAIFGHIKHQILGDRDFETISELQAAAVSAFRQRVTAARIRRDQSWDRALAVA